MLKPVLRNPKFTFILSVQSMALVAFHIHVDNLIADAVDIVTLGLFYFLIPQRYFIATIAVWTTLNWIASMCTISSRCIRNNSLSSTSAFCLFLDVVLNSSSSLPFLDKFIRLKATSILSLKRRIKKWLTRLCLQVQQACPRRTIWNSSSLPRSSYLC